MSPPLVSVLMTVFNAAPFVRQAIESILSQTVRDIELIVVDDCSADGSWLAVSDAASRDPRIVALRRDVRGGASAGLNMALARARGHYITRQDGDDVSLPARLEQQLAFLARHPQIGAVGTAVRLIDEHGTPGPVWEVPRTDADIQRALLESMCFCGPTVLVRREAFEAAGCWFDESLSGSEDYDLCLRLAEVAALANLGEPLYLYRQHADSVSRSDESRQLYRKASALERTLRRRFGSVWPPRGRTRVARDFVTAAIMAHAKEPTADVQEWCSRGVALDPGVLDDSAWLESIIRKCTPVFAAVAFRDSIFRAVLPQTPTLGRLRRRLLADAHMEEVFEGANRRDGVRVREHLWPAIRNNPGWLANRGVLSLLLQAAVGRRGGAGG